MMAWDHFEACMQGGRSYQEDDCGVFELPPSLHGGGLLLVLADGMGGEQAGDRASAIAVRSFIDAYASGAAPTIPQRLYRALEHANQELALEVATDAALSGMGCTLLAAVLTDRELYWISVGDSPLWLWRKGALLRLNQDHSYRQVLAQQVAAGEISPEEAGYHPDRNALISALTGEPLTLVDWCTEPYSLQPGDRILLASDGLLTLSEVQIAAYLQVCPSTRVTCQGLLEAVLAADYAYQDNVTVMLAQAAEGHLSWRRLRVALLLVVLAALGAGGLWWGKQEGWPWLPLERLRSEQVP